MLGAAGAWTLLRPATSQAQARAIIARYGDKDWSLCDAISFACIETRGVGTAFSFDRHFAQYGRFRLLGLARER